MRRLITVLGFAAAIAVGGAAPPTLQPLLSGKWPSFFRGAATDVKVAGNYAFVAIPQGGLAVFDVTNPTNWLQVGGYFSGEIDWNVALSGNYAFLANPAGLHVIDVRDPTNAFSAGRHEITGHSDDVALQGNYAFVADGLAGLQVIDVGNPAKCVRVGGCDTEDSIAGVAVSGHYAYVMDRTPGLLVIDVSDPSHCVLVGSYDNKGRGDGVVVVDGRVYPADGYAGLVVLPAVRNVQFTVRVEALPNVPFTLETATSLDSAWTPLLTTNSSTKPFDFVDFDVKISDKPQKYYRVRQP